MSATITTTVSNQSAIDTLIESLSAVKSPRFINFVYKTAIGEVSKYCVLVGANYSKHVAHDLKNLMAYEPKNEEETIAKAELIKSMTEHLENGVSSNYTKIGYYEPKSKNGVVKESVKDTIYFNGYLISKKVIVPAPENTKKRSVSLKESIKRVIKAKVLKFREFKINVNDIKNISINSKHIVFESNID